LRQQRVRYVQHDVDGGGVPAGGQRGRQVGQAHPVRVTGAPAQRARLVDQVLQRLVRGGVPEAHRTGQVDRQQEPPQLHVRLGGGRDQFADLRLTARAGVLPARLDPPDRVPGQPVRVLVQQGALLGGAVAPALRVVQPPAPPPVVAARPAGALRAYRLVYLLEFLARLLGGGVAEPARAGRRRDEPYLPPVQLESPPHARQA